MRPCSRLPCRSVFSSSPACRRSSVAMRASVPRGSPPSSPSPPGRRAPAGFGGATDRPGRHRCWGHGLHWVGRAGLPRGMEPAVAGLHARLDRHHLSVRRLADGAVTSSPGGTAAAKDWNGSCVIAWPVSSCRAVPRTGHQLALTPRSWARDGMELSRRYCSAWRSGSPADDGARPFAPTFDRRRRPPPHSLPRSRSSCGCRSFRRRAPRSGSRRSPMWWSRRAAATILGRNTNFWTVSIGVLVDDACRSDGRSGPVQNQSPCASCSISSTARACWALLRQTGSRTRESLPRRPTGERGVWLRGPHTRRHPRSSISSCQVGSAALLETASHRTNEKQQART